jgi:hypothetical protein
VHVCVEILDLSAVAFVGLLREVRVLDGAVFEDEAYAEWDQEHKELAGAARRLAGSVQGLGQRLEGATALAAAARVGVDAGSADPEAEMASMIQQTQEELVACSERVSRKRMDLQDLHERYT